MRFIFTPLINSYFVSQAEIEEGLEKVCSYVPSAFASECKSFIEEYGPMIVKLLLQELDPKTVCTELGLCSSKPGEDFRYLIFLHFIDKRK